VDGSSSHPLQPAFARGTRREEKIVIRTKYPKKRRCQFCNKAFNTQAGVNGHSPYCQMNPNKKTSWNKGLTKETSEIMKQVGIKIRKTQNDPDWINSTGMEKIRKIKKTKKENPPQKAWNKGLTKENSEKVREISQKLKEAYVKTSDAEKERRRLHARTETLKRIARNPHARFHDTKPEKEMKQFLNHLGITYKQNYPVFTIKHAYPADFLLPDYNMIVEVDGKHWHNFPLLNKVDIQRTTELREQGFSVLRLWEDTIPILWDMKQVFLEHLENTKKCKRRK
jgi:very-short-patch-repair endonuclease